MEGISVTGLDKAIALCRLAPQKVDEQLRLSMVAALTPVLGEAKSAAPVRSGRLRDSGRIKISTKRAHPSVSISFGGAKAPYAGVRMFGKRVTVRGSTRRLVPDPFLFRIGERRAAVVADKIIADFQRVLSKLAGR